MPGGGGRVRGSRRGAPRAAFSILFLLALGAASAPVVWAEGEEPGPVVVWGDPGLEGEAVRVRAALPSVEEDVHLRLGVRRRGAAEIAIVRGIERMREVARARVPEWAGGVCVGSRGLIVLRADVAQRPPFRTLLTTVRHEWVHLVLAQNRSAESRGHPLWFEEGVAEAVGGGISVEGAMRLDVAAARNRLLDFADLVAAFPEAAQDASLAYAQSESFVTYLQRQAGSRALRDVVASLLSPEAPPADETSALDRALRDATDDSLDRWVAFWRADLEERAAPWFHLVLKDLGWSLIVLVSFLSLGAFFWVRRRRARQIAALPDEPWPPGQGP
jgi:hypothetical protein